MRRRRINNRFSSYSRPKKEGDKTKPPTSSLCLLPFPSFVAKGLLTVTFFSRLQFVGLFFVRIAAAGGDSSGDHVGGEREGEREREKEREREREREREEEEEERENKKDREGESERERERKRERE
jgi:hypothetical protein